jgi:hypothetical protein
MEARFSLTLEFLIVVPIVLELVLALAKVV